MLMLTRSSKTLAKRAVSLVPKTMISYSRSRDAQASSPLLHMSDHELCKQVVGGSINFFNIEDEINDASRAVSVRRAAVESMLMAGEMSLHTHNYDPSYRQHTPESVDAIREKIRAGFAIRQRFGGTVHTSSEDETLYELN